MFKSLRVGALAAALMAATSLTAVAEVVLHRDNGGEPETLDPHKTSVTTENNILKDMYEGLIGLSADGKLIPGMAESWTISDDGTVYTFNLRDAKWSNGDPVVAGDFEYSLRRIMDPATGAKYATVLYPIKNAEKVNKSELPKEELGVKAIDDKTLEITLESPTPYFLGLLQHQTGLPVHPATVEEHGTDFVRPENVVTNGAFIITEFVPNSHVTVVRNENYYGNDDVQIDKVVFHNIEDRGAAVRRFEAGEFHIVDEVPTEQMAHVKSTMADQLLVAPYLGTYYYALNHESEKLKDPGVRQALSMAIDREFLADEIFAGTMSVAYSIVPPGIDNYGEPAYAEYKGQSMIDREDEARELLEAAGYNESNPLKLELRYNTNENHKNAAIAIADMWKPLGVEVSMLNTDVKTHYAHLRDQGDFDVARAGWIGDYSDPQNFLFLVESDNTGFNYARYNNPEYDALMDKAAATLDLEKRADIMKQAEVLFMRDLPFIPILHYSSKKLVSDKISGYEPNLRDEHQSRWITVSE
ncbi:oligopeptide transport system substrate-binding protein [Roseibium hamelinense]|uniref:Oligopeptide transport system substrate-binding protein n=1 Tax=Roseibium hamelinense TaxID=150831 RepID=A0A562SVG1_9HYPH|nr:peptide ABC transporter substrate-binding protein [Roseibium hamelinense]MTI43175.1 peptide ABC transporter substrate-binding protein [Roseibium hamelinense]TWI84776.1 oligopeptide transport system substrate-binding protein [Roseibium hamelinense]